MEQLKSVFFRIKKRYGSLPIQVRASLWFLICSFLQKGISAITTPIFTRLMSVEQYGQYSVFVSWETILAVFITFSLSSGVYIQGLVKFEEEKEQYTSSLQGLTFTLVFIWFCIYLLFRNFFNNLFSLSTQQMILLFLQVWMSAIFGFWSSYQRTEYKYKKLVFLTFILSLAQPIFSMLLLKISSNKALARIAGQVLVQVILFIGLFGVQMYRGKKFYIKKFWRHALLFNLPLIPHYLSTTVLNSADRIMIAKMVGDEEAGIYSLAYSISLLMTMFNAALQQTLEPWRYKKQKIGKPEEMANVAYPTLILIAGLNLLLIAFAPEILLIFAPKEYYAAIWIIPAVSMSTYFMYMYGWFANFAFYYEKTNYVMIATTVGAVLNVVLNDIFIRKFGYYAAGYTTLFCYIVYALAHYFFMKRICKKNLNGKKIYDMKIIIIISVVFMLLGITFLFTYRCILYRYTIICGLVAILIKKRRYIYELINKLIGIRTKGDI